jgi:hypothetical protein
VLVPRCKESPRGWKEYPEGVLRRRIVSKDARGRE